MSQAHSGLAEINGARLYYEVAGAGYPLVMLHGHLIDSGQWDDQVTTFAASYRVVRYDARGFGRSTLPPAPFAYQEDLAALLRFLGIERACLIGSSGGGATIIDLALTYPEMVDALILVGASLGGYRPAGPAPQQLIAMNEARRSGEVDWAVELSLQALTDGPRRTPQQVNAVARERTRTMSAHLFARPAVPEAVQQMLEPPAIERLSDIRAPALVIVGSEDQPPIHEIAGIITARVPDAQKVMIPDAAHHPNMEHPESFNQIVRSFLRSIGR